MLKRLGLVLCTLLASHSFLISQSAAAIVPSDDTLKLCLMFIHESEESHFKNHHAYSKALDELHVSENAYCRQAKVSIERASKKEFKATAELRNRKWSVNQQKKLVNISR